MRRSIIDTSGLPRGEKVHKDLEVKVDDGLYAVWGLKRLSRHAEGTKGIVGDASFVLTKGNEYGRGKGSKGHKK